ncbi:MAG: zinc ribbon domain-containing protein YjdM [Bdellovibrionales bacterium]
MDNGMKCPACGSAYAYQDGHLWICPECAHEWSGEAPRVESAEPDNSVRDANGNRLETGDTVTIIKDLKVKGASSTLKGGTKVRNIRLVDGADGHNIACRIDGIGALNLKSEFVRKS